MNILPIFRVWVFRTLLASTQKDFLLLKLLERRSLCNTVMRFLMPVRYTVQSLDLLETCGKYLYSCLPLKFVVCPCKVFGENLMQKVGFLHFNSLGKCGKLQNSTSCEGFHSSWGCCWEKYAEDHPHWKSKHGLILFFMLNSFSNSSLLMGSFEVGGVEDNDGMSKAPLAWDVK